MLFAPGQTVSPPIGYASGRTKKSIGRSCGQEVGDLRHEGQRRPLIAVTSSFAALRNDDFGLRFHCKARIGQALDITIAVPEIV